MAQIKVWRLVVSKTANGKEIVQSIQEPVVPPWNTDDTVVLQDGETEQVIGYVVDKNWHNAMEMF